MPTAAAPAPGGGAIAPPRKPTPPPAPPKPVEQLEEALDEPYPTPQIDDPLLPQALHDKLMPLVQDVLWASGSTGIEKVLPAALAANFQAAGFIFTNLELWTDPTGGIQRNLRQILHHLHLLPEFSDVTMDHALSWLTHKTGVHYRELMPKMLPPSTTPSPAATPPPTTYASILNSLMPAEARNIRTPRPVQASSTAALPTTSSRPRSDQIPSKG